MSHYLQEKILDAESATGAEREQIRRECFEVILMLWENRANFPEGLAPYGDLNKVVDVILYLDPNNPNPFYYQGMLNREDYQGENGNLVNKIVDTDHFARSMVSFLLRELMRMAIADSTEEWVELSKGIEPAENRILVKLLPEFSISNQNNKAEINRSEVENDLISHVSEIEKFEGILSEVKKFLNERLIKEQAK